MSIFSSILKQISEDQRTGLRILYCRFFSINILKTLYVNFKALSIRNAIKIPIIVGHNVKIIDLGTIIIDAPITTGMFSIGVLRIPTLEHSSDNKFIFYNGGILRLKGRVKLHTGVKFSNSGEITLGGKNTIGACTKVVCHSKIVIGYNSGCSWHCEIFDTDFHQLKDIVSGRLLKMDSPIFIGDNVFIGNHCNISRSTKIPNGCVITSWSRVSGSYRKDGENLLISGNPAKVIDKGYMMIDASGL